MKQAIKQLYKSKHLLIAERISFVIEILLPSLLFNPFHPYKL